MLKHTGSQQQYPDQAFHNVQPIFGPFLDYISAIPQQNEVDFLVRGWDGASTHAQGLVNFVKRYGSGPGCNLSGRSLNFKFWFFQPRQSTSPEIAELFGNAPLPVWWSQAPQGHPAWALETALGARIHPPFTHQTYLATVSTAVAQAGNLASRQGNSTLTLLYVLGEIDRVKAAGGTQQQPNGPENPLYNQSRNWIPW